MKNRFAVIPEVDEIGCKASCAGKDIRWMKEKSSQRKAMK